ncbi:MAG: hypothetical protein ACO1OQ_02645 [Rufibacter sp.]
MEETSAKCSLIDSTQRGPLQPEADEWIFNALLQEVKNVEIEGHQLALVMTEDRYKNMVQDYSLSQARLMQLPIQFSYFTRMEEAMHWLLQE